MPLSCTPRIERMTAAVTGRAQSLLADDLLAHDARLREAVEGKRILISGGAGSIGTATALALIRYRPAALVVLDTNENNLAELVRHLRGQPDAFTGELLVQPLDYGSRLAERFLARQVPFDLVLSFAALKHVRSERDEWSLTRMLEVNLVKADRFLAVLRRQGHGRHGVFFVSTDKAANAVSLMGASKRAMELLLWAHCDQAAPASLLDGGAAPAIGRMTTARFANVAFSDGSLPWGFLQRLEKGQPLACPGDIRRYLVSPSEAGQICLLGSLVCPHRHLVFPRLDPQEDMSGFTDVAAATLHEFGLEPSWYDDPEKARQAVVEERTRGRYPVVVTRSDTSGEKDVEEFVGAGEEVMDIGLRGLQALAGGTVDLGAMACLLGIIDRAATGEAVLAKADLAAALGQLVPGFAHRETGLSLDRKM
jgi:nucleoside-diphosphate-sugar epimerase